LEYFFRYWGKKNPHKKETNIKTLRENTPLLFSQALLHFRLLSSLLLSLQVTLSPLSEATRRAGGLWSGHSG